MRNFMGLKVYGQALYICTSGTVVARQKQEDYSSETV